MYSTISVGRSVGRSVSQSVSQCGRVSTPSFTRNKQHICVISKLSRTAWVGFILQCHNALNYLRLETQIDNVIIELHETRRAIIGLPVASGHLLFDYTGLSCHKQQTRRHSRSTGSDNSSLMIACRALARSGQISILADCFCFRSQFGYNHITRAI